MNLRRIASLDALRGVAALGVVVCHAILFLAFTSPVALAARSILGGLPVMTFFVLSGYVLSLPFFSEAPQTATAFLIRRFMRIYVPYVIITAAIVAVLWIASPGHLGEGGRPITPAVLLNALVLLSADGRAAVIDPVIWSLFVECVYSLAFIPLVLALRRFPLPVFIIMALAIAVVPTWNRVGISPLAWGPLFAAGILIAQYRPRISFRFWYALPALIAAGLLNYYVAFTFAAVLLVVLVPQTFTKVSPALRWLGEISYSLYLIHFPIFLISTRFLGPALGVFAALPLIFLTSTLSYRYVEKPCIELGRRMTQAKPPLAEGGAVSIPLPS